MKKKTKQLEDLLMDRMIQALSDPETATPGIMQAALRYLNDHVSESAIIEPGSKVDQILDSLPFKMTGTDD